MRPATMKAWFLIHKWTSLVSTLFLLLLCVTGLPLVFAHEIDHALGRSVEPPEIEHTGPRADLDAIVAGAAARRPGEAVQFVLRDADEPDLWYVRLGKTPADPEPTAFYYYDARTGALLHEYPLGQGVMNVLFRLHVDMFAGLPGTLFLGFMGLLLAAALVSGAVLYAPYMKKLRFGTIRRNRTLRLKWLDLHNLLGIATLVWLLVVGLTGVINTLSLPIFGHWQATQLADMAAPHLAAAPAADRPPSPARAVESALAAAPDKQLSFLAFPGTGYAPDRHFVAFLQGTTPLTSKLLVPSLIDAHTARVLDTRPLPWYVSALLLSQPLHFGDYGGLPLKLLWALLDLLAIAVLISGLKLWLDRRHVTYEEWSLTHPLTERALTT